MGSWVWKCEAYAPKMKQMWSESEYAHAAACEVAFRPCRSMPSPSSDFARCCSSPQRATIVPSGPRHPHRSNMSARSLCFCALTSLLTAFAGNADALCFSIYDAGETLIYRSTLAPIDMSRPISEGMAQQFPRGRLLITDDRPCQIFSPSPGSSFVFVYGSPATGPTYPATVSGTQPPGDVDVR